MTQTKITSKQIEVNIRFYGNGNIVEKRPSVFVGGIVPPEIKDLLFFNVRREVPDEDGVLNPICDEQTVKGAFQINIWGTSEGYRQLAENLLAVSELDIGNDPSFHEHHHVASSDGRTDFHLIIRKPG